MKNKISISTLRGFSVEESVRFALDCGFDGIEIQTDYLPDTKEEQKKIIEMAMREGLDVSLHAPCADINIASLNKGIRKESIAQVKNAIDIAEKFNLRVVTFHPGRLSSARENEADKWNVLMDSVSEIAQYSKTKKVYSAIENMELRKKELVLTAEHLNRFCSVSENNEFFGVTLDFCHFATNGIFSGEIGDIRIPVYNVHLSQSVNSKPHYPAYEEGDIDFREVPKALQRYNYSSAVVMELKSVFDAEVYKKSKMVLENA